MSGGTRPGVALRRWAPDDLALLRRLLGEPVMCEHLGGPEADDAIRARHERYLADTRDGLFAIVVGAESTAAGWVGYWEAEWHGAQVWEAGWSVLPEFQRQGVASAGVALAVDEARADGRHRLMHAFPSVENAASNALCRRLGFELLGEADVEYPKGHTMRSNDWRLDLLGGA